MKKKLKTRRFICVILCLGMLFSMQSNVFATDIALIGSEPINFSAINSELNTPEFKALLRTFLDDDAIRTSTDAELMNAKIGSAFSYIVTSPSISAASEANANTSVRYYPITNNGKVLAIVGVAECNGDVSYTISEAYAPYLNMLMEQSGVSLIRIIETETGLFAVSGTKAMSLLGDTRGRTVDVTQTSQLSTDTTASVIDVNESGLNVSTLIDASTSILSVAANYSYEMPNFPLVSQYTNNCWTGCIASITNYLGVTPGITAYEVYEDAVQGGYPIGYTSGIVSLLDSYCAADGRYAAASYYGVPSTGDIMFYVNNNIPLIMGGHSYPNNAVPHVTVVIGYSMYSEGVDQLFQVKMMNPQIPQYQWTTVSSSNYYTYMSSKQGYYWYDTILLLNR